MSIKSILEDRKKAKAKEEMKKKAKFVAIGAAAGTALGVVGGILSAPKSGKETRQDIVNTSKKASSEITSKINEGKDQITEAKAKIKQYIDDRKSKKEVAATEEQPIEATTQEK